MTLILTSLLKGLDVNYHLSETISTLSVQSEFRPYAEGSFMIFQSSARHCVQNMGENDSISLVFDIFRKGRGIL